MFFYAVVIVTISYIGYVLTSCFFNYRKLAHIDGPFLAKIGPFWLMYHTLRGDLYTVLGPLMKQYGVPMRLAPNLVAYDDPEVRHTTLTMLSLIPVDRFYDRFMLQDHLS